MNECPLTWTAPAPLWPELIPAPGAVPSGFDRPAVLRFASDSFMDDFLVLLERDPAGIRHLVARYESWRGILAQSQEDNALDPERKLVAQARSLRRLAAARRGAWLRPLGRPTAGNDEGTVVRKRLKMYPPVHQRYYLVTSSLVCRTNGFPDHRPDPGRQERAGFVMRRLLPPVPHDPQKDLPEFDPATWEEYAFVVTSKGPGWRRIEIPAERKTLIPGEELLPLFPSAYREENGRRRNLLAGLVPVGRREAYLGAPKQLVISEAGGDPSFAGVRQGTGSKTARMALFRTQVAEPWKRLIEIAFAADARVFESSSNTDIFSIPVPVENSKNIIESARAQIQIGSWLILLEFADYLQNYVPDVWDQVVSSSPAESGAPLLQALERIVLDGTATEELATEGYPKPKVLLSLRDALAAIKGGRPFTAAKASALQAKIEKATSAFRRKDPPVEWPDFLFPLADPYHKWKPVEIAVLELSENDEVEAPPRMDEGDITGVKEYLQSVDRLVALVTRALPKEPPPGTDVPAPPLAAHPALDHRADWFVIRCAFARPRCGPLHDDVVSDATEPFELAGFFDPDAPVRPLRIALPMDTTPAGLSKFNKNTAFMISDVLCGQIKRAKGLGFGDLVRSVLPWPFHKDLDEIEGGPCKTEGGTQLGMICSISIPIITICAFILLMIMVSLLDIIFRWIPWFITCFPLPGFKAKR